MNRKQKILLSLSSLLFLIIPFFAPTAHAGEIIKGIDITAEKAGAKPNEGSGKELIVNRAGTIIKGIIGLTGILLVLLIIYAGFLWMSAAGSETQVKKAKQTLSAAIIGLLIVVFAYIITVFVFDLTGDSVRGDKKVPDCKRQGQLCNNTTDLCCFQEGLTCRTIPPGKGTCQ